MILPPATPHVERPAPPDSGETTLPANPYPGFEPYGEQHWEVFFGRESERLVMAANLAVARLTVLYGPSGVGKSSLLRAGVAHDLDTEAQTDVEDPYARPGIAVILRDWGADPLTQFDTYIRGKAPTLRPDLDMDEAPQITALTDGLAQWTEFLDADILLILDQFEEFFLYHPVDSGFGAQLVESTNRRDLPVRFLIAVREESLADLDAFRGKMPSLLHNRLRLGHLSVDAAHDAIRGPVEVLNKTQAADAQIEIEDGLVDAVVASARIEGDVRDIKEVEAPFLSLVMQDVWIREERNGSRSLRQVTLEEEAGGAAKIARNHVDGAMAALSEGDRDTAASVFDRLLTPTGSKVALNARDLAGWTDLPEEDIARVLKSLSAGEVRILRPKASPIRTTQDDDASSKEADPDAASPSPLLRYEVFHDVLATGIINWSSERRRAYEERVAGEREEERRVQQRDVSLLVASIVVLLMAVTGVVITISADLLQSELELAAPLAAVLVAGLAIFNYREEPRDRPRRWFSAVALGASLLAILLSLANGQVIGADADVHAFLLSAPDSTVVPVVSPQVVDFEDVVVNAQQARTVSISNGGSVAWTVTEVLADDVRTSGCTEANLLTDEECAIEVIVQPTETGPFREEVAISMETESGETQAVATFTVTGEAVEFPTATATPTFVDFDAVIIGSDEVPTRVVTVANDSDRAIRISAVGVTSSTGFGLAGEGCVDKGLQPGATCEQQVDFLPSTAGTTMAELTVEYQDAEQSGPMRTIEATLQAVAAPRLPIATPAILEFGLIAVGITSPPQGIELDSVDLDVGQYQDLEVVVGDEEQFPITGADCEEIPCVLEVRFAPASVGFVETDLTVRYTAENGQRLEEQIASISGLGSAPRPSEAIIVDVGEMPVAVAVGHEQVWVTNFNSGTISRIGLEGEALSEFPIAAKPDGVAVDEEGVWVVTNSGMLFFIDPVGSIRKQFSLDTRAATKLAVGPDGIWVVAPLDDEILHFDPSTEEIVDSIDVGDRPVDIAIGAGAIWVTNRDDNTVSRVDPDTSSSFTIPVGESPIGVAAGDDYVWVANFASNTVIRIDPTSCDGTTCQVVSTIDVGKGPDGIAVDSGYVWVTNSKDASVARIDRETLDVEFFRVGTIPDGIALNGDAVWVANSGDSTVMRLPRQ